MDLQILNKSFLENSDGALPTELYNPSCKNENDIVNSNIDSYMLGFKKSTHDVLDQLCKLHLDHLKKAIDITYSSIIPVLKKDHKIKCYNFYINAEKDRYFEFLISIDESDFSSNKRKSAYQFFIQTKKELRQKGFDLNYSFIPFTDKINNDALVSDGYNFKFEL